MCRPLEERRAPATLADAKFSLPFLVAVAIVRRGMSVSDFSETALRDADVLAAAGKITLVPDADLDWTLEMPPGRVEIIASSGRRWMVEGRDVPGGTTNPMIWDDLCRKFRECGAVAVTPVSEAALTKAIDLATRLEDLPDATELMRCLSQDNGASGMERTPIGGRRR
jgi:2-methylcitrate dehydratase PrpD